MDFTPVASEAVADPSISRRVAERPVEIELAPGLRLAGDLRLPEPASGLVAFAHGSGSSRLSPRNRQVAAALNEAGFASLLFDLLTTEEELDRANVFDIALLAERLLAVTAWARDEADLSGLAIGYFGASTGAAAALRAAADLGAEVRAVVSRGGRPDLAAERLERVAAPTLLIVGGADRQVLELNEAAARLLRCEHEIAVVSGATHLFEEPGALERVSELAAEWFSRHLPGVAPQ
jgi:putative phosphoribosyl transferase